MCASSEGSEVLWISAAESSTEVLWTHIVKFIHALLLLQAGEACSDSVGL